MIHPFLNNINIIDLNEKYMDLIAVDEFFKRYAHKADNNQINFDGKLMISSLYGYTAIVSIRKVIQDNIKWYSLQAGGKRCVIDNQQLIPLAKSSETKRSDIIYYSVEDIMKLPDNSHVVLYRDFVIPIEEMSSIEHKIPTIDSLVDTTNFGYVISVKSNLYNINNITVKSE